MPCLEAGDPAIWICVLHSTEQGSDKMLYSWPLGKESWGEWVGSPIDPGNNLPFPLGFRACLHFMKVLKKRPRISELKCGCCPRHSSFVYCWLFQDTMDSLFFGGNSESFHSYSFIKDCQKACWIYYWGWWMGELGFPSVGSFFDQV